MEGHYVKEFDLSGCQIIKRQMSKKVFLNALLYVSSLALPADC